MRKLSHEEISSKRPKLEEVNKIEKLPVVVVLNSIRSSYNVGSIFRTSDGAMIEKLYLCGYTPCPPKKEVLKTALGSTESVQWEYSENPLDVVKKYKEKGYTIGALELTEGSIPHYNFPKSKFPLCLVIGNEISGVSQEVLDECDYALEIPQYGIKQSLNVGVAYGISIFELRKIFELGN